MTAAATTEMLLLDSLATPIGMLLVLADEQQRLRALDWHDYEARMHRLLRLHYGDQGRGYQVQQGALPAPLRQALEHYFAGDLGAIDSIAVHTGGTAFQREVWQALRTIPAGHTLSYGALAARLGRPKAVRAVGLANGANPIGIVVPCHRVIGANGALTGYGGGIERKQWLLAHEGVIMKL